RRDLALAEPHEDRGRVVERFGALKLVDRRRAVARLGELHALEPQTSRERDVARVRRRILRERAGRYGRKKKTQATPRQRTHDVSPALKELETEIRWLRLGRRR